MVETLEAITQEREADEPIWGSMIKQAIKRRNPGFNERAYGFRSFNDMLLEAHLLTRFRNLGQVYSISTSTGVIDEHT